MKVKMLIVCFILCVSCSKSDDGQNFSLPPITQTGENTFGCYIDGRLLIPRNGTGTWMGPDPGMTYSGYGTFPNYVYNEIHVHDFKSGNGGMINIHIISLHENSEGNYIINESNCQNGIDANVNINLYCRLWNEKDQKFDWYCSIENGGTLTITRYDFDKGIVSGTFSCVAINRNNLNDTIEITKGRFDINWKELTPYTEFP